MLADDGGVKMEREAFWHSVIGKGHNDLRSLSGPERDWLAIRHLCGEAYVNGIVAYFELHGHDYPTTRDLVLRYGFTDLVRILDAVAEVIFHGADLSDPQQNRESVAKYEALAEETGHDEVDAGTEALLAHLRRLDATADEKARAAGLFT